MDVLRLLPDPSPDGDSGQPSYTPALDLEQIEQIHRQLVLLKNGRSARPPMRRVDSTFRLMALVGTGCLALTFVSAAVVPTYGPVAANLGWFGIGEAIALVAGLLVYAAIVAARLTKGGSTYNYETRAPMRPLEVQFVNAAVAYDEVNLSFVQDEAESLAKHQGRGIGVALRLIGYPVLLAILSAAFGASAFIGHQWVGSALILTGVFMLFGFTRFNDVEQHERHEQLLGRAADIAATRAGAKTT